MKIGRLVYIFMPAAILSAFLLAPKAEILGDSSRVIYFHVPLAMVSVISFVYAGIISLVYLLRGGALLPEKARNSAGIGIVCTALTALTGSLWAKMAWGSYWNWDPRETSIIILLLIYTAYLSLYASLENNTNRGKICSAYLILTMAVMPFFVFVIPRVYHSLHPDTIINSEGVIKIETSMRAVLLISAAAFVLLYIYLMDIKNRLLNIEKVKHE
ncbi:MAG: cytochrome c biogenesis protein [Spirochaetia bacterium]|jgi:heme exporter protein C|nr:cytochrome c biogenesis protein [Spirochaetia bacterium]